MLISSIYLLSSCGQTQTENERLDIPTGIWRGVIATQEVEIPFNFVMDKNEQGLITMTLINGEEQILIDDIAVSKDSLFIPMHIFDTQLRVRFDGTRLTGSWIKNYVKDYVLPFSAIPGHDFRFEQVEESAVNMSGRYKVYFLTENDSSEAVGIFHQSGDRLTGTFLKATGDYRYLEGNVSGKNFHLSTFDGEHAYLFYGNVSPNGYLEGMYTSGKTWTQAWIGVPDESASLPDPDSLTFLKEGYNSIEFNLPNMKGDMVSLNDDRFTDKVVIVQISGTWCPNCMDETKFLSSWYDQNAPRGVEIIALAFERKDEFDYAKSRIDRMVSKYGIHYEFLFAGQSKSGEVLKVLPMLNQFKSYPTTIFIDRSGRVRKIHTGFSGPGTGEAYATFVEDFNLYMDKLLAE